MGNTLHFPVGIATLGVALEAHSVWAHEAIPDGFPAKSLLIPCPLMKFADLAGNRKVQVDSEKIPCRFPCFPARQGKPLRGTLL
jgi:hypothetical protein